MQEVVDAFIPQAVRLQPGLPEMHFLGRASGIPRPLRCTTPLAGGEWNRPEDALVARPFAPLM